MDWLRKIPIGQYVSGNSGWLRTLDPRVKFAWVLMFLLTPVLASSIWRIGLVIGLFLITFFSCLPLRIWWRSFTLLLILSLLVGTFAMALPVSEVAPVFAVRSPTELPQAIIQSPSWEIFKFGPINLGGINVGPFIVDRRSAELGIKTSTLLFTVIHSVNLMLITTSPEDLVWALRWFVTPLKFLGIPIDRLCFQLLLSLRFLPLVQEELQNLLRSLSMRAVNFRDLGFKSSISLFLSVSERLLANILLRADQGAESLMAKNQTAMSPSQFRRYKALSLRSYVLNFGSVVLLMMAIIIRGKYGTF